MYVHILRRSTIGPASYHTGTMCGDIRLAASAIALTLLCSVRAGQLPLSPPPPPYDPSHLEGQVCGPPPNGYLPLPCGSRKVVGVVEEQLDPDSNGLVRAYYVGHGVAWVRLMLSCRSMTQRAGFT